MHQPGRGVLKLQGLRHDFQKGSCAKRHLTVLAFPSRGGKMPPVVIISVIKFHHHKVQSPSPSHSLRPLRSICILWWAVRHTLPGNIPWRSHQNWCYTSARPILPPGNLHPWSKEAGRRTRTAQKKYVSIPAQRSREFFQNGQWGEHIVSPLALNVTGMAGWLVWTRNQDLEITTLFACWIAIYILYK